MSIEVAKVREYLDKDLSTRKEIVQAAAELGLKHNKILRVARKVDYGVYNLELAEKNETPEPVAQPTKVVPFRQERKILSKEDIQKGYIPEKDPCFVPFGDYSVIDAVIASKKFCPTVITGDSGNGKTKMVEQACAKNKRHFYRMNVTIETDEMDILGHYNLVNGETVWEDSPLVEAAKVGGVVLLDEIFAGNPARMLCLQGILEGKPFLIKKTGERIIPAKGFNIIATDNTKGNGSESGRYIGTNIQNTAFLERFVMCIEHDYPTKAKEIKMLDKYLEVHNIDVEDAKFTEKLCQWAEVTRKSYKDEAIDEMITTRRLFHILDIYSILGDKEKALQYAIARFDEEVRDSFVSLYKKLDETIQDPNHQPVDPENMVTFDTVLEQVANQFTSSTTSDERDEIKKELIQISADEIQNWKQAYDSNSQSDLEELSDMRNWLNSKYSDLVRARDSHEDEQPVELDKPITHNEETAIDRLMKDLSGTE